MTDRPLAGLNVSTFHPRCQHARRITCRVWASRDRDRDPRASWHPSGMVEFARLLGLRFSHDKGCPAERFETLRRTLGDSFECIEIDSSPGNPLGIRSRAHSVLTVDLVDQPGHSTRAGAEPSHEPYPTVEEAR